MTSSAPLALAGLTTLGVGGPARRYVETSTQDALVAAVVEADEAREPLLVLGGGSNVVVGDDGFDGVVVRDRRDDLRVTDRSDCAGITVVATAGTPWARFVDHAVEHGLTGVEALAGIPGSVGATPVQNVGAYGQEVAQTIASVRVWDRAARAVRTMPVGDLRFGYRTSLLKASMRPDPADPVAPWGPTPRYVVLEVTFQLREASLSRPVAYPELAATLGVAVGDRAPLAEVHEAVLNLRAGKGMLLDPADPDTRSAGSFFTNPVLDAATAATLPPEAPRFDTDGRIKTSAAWLISRAGFAKGHGLPGPAALSTKHVLALTNRGGATASDVLALAREIREGVRARFGLTLEPEPVLVGCTL